MGEDAGFYVSGGKNAQRPFQWCA